MDLVLFDLDQTLIDSSAIEEFRKTGDWESAEKHFSDTSVFYGIRELLENLSGDHILGVVTSSPRVYAQKLLSFHKIDIPVLAAYHDTKRHKPFADPFKHARGQIQDPIDDVIIVGDQVEDIRGGRAAGLNSMYLANWGHSSEAILASDLQAHILKTPSELLDYLRGENSMQPLDFIEFDLASEIVESIAISYYFKKGSIYEDPISKSLRDQFKDGDSNTVKFWVQRAVETLELYIEETGLEINQIVRVLGSEELKPSGDAPLDILGEKLAEILQVEYTPNVLFKTRKTNQLKHTPLRSQREDELKDVYKVTEDSIEDGAHILLIDDICTSGTTAKSITREILKASPNAKVFLLVLGKTSNPSWGTPSTNRSELLALGAELGVWSADEIGEQMDVEPEENYTCAIGIDLGTTNSLLAYRNLDDESSSIQFLPIEQPSVTGRVETDVLCPSVVYYHNKSGRVFVGRGAEQRKYDAISERTVFFSSKSKLGQKVLFHNSLHPNIRYPYQVSSAVIEYLLQSFVKQVKTPLDQCKVVVTVPASFGGSQRIDTLKAIGEAGIDVEEGDLVDEPNAAFIGYVSQFSKHKIPDGSKVLIFDMGGGTTDISIVELLGSRHGEYDVRNLAVSRYDLIGGDDIDSHIAATFLLTRLYSQNGIDESEWTYSEREKLVMSKLRKRARSLKESIASKLLWHIQQIQGYDLNEIPWDQLPEDNEITVEMPDAEIRIKGKMYILSGVQMTFSQFKKLLKPFLERQGAMNERKDEYHIISIFTLLSSLEQVSEIPPEQIDYLLFVGGSTLNPMIVDAVHQYYPKSNILNFSDTEIIDRIVAYGAVVFAEQKAKHEPIPIIPIVPDRIGILAQGKEFVPIIPSGVQVPFPIGENDYKFSDALNLPSSDSSSIQIPICVGTHNRIYQTIQIPRNKLAGEVSIGFRITEGKTLECKILHEGKVIKFELNNPVTVYSSDDYRINTLNEALFRHRNAVIRKELNRDRRTLEVAEAYSNLHKEPQAVEYAQSLLRDDVEDSIRADALFTIGYSSSGGTAIKYYEQYLELRPEATSATFNLGISYEQVGEFNKADQIWSESIQGEYESDLTRAALANLRKKRGGEYRALAEQAIERLERLVKGGKQQDATYYWLIKCYDILGDKENVKLWVQRREEYSEKKNRVYDENALLEAGLMGVDEL